jgi:hypothetical protein
MMQSRNRRRVLYTENETGRRDVVWTGVGGSHCIDCMHRQNELNFQSIP